MTTRYRGRELRDPTPDQYIEAVKEAAKSDPKICYTRVFMNTRKRSAVIIRWRAWRSLAVQNCSISGIARASGFDHTTVLHGINQIAKIEPLPTSGGVPS